MVMLRFAAAGGRDHSSQFPVESRQRLAPRRAATNARKRAKQSPTSPV